MCCTNFHDHEHLPHLLTHNLGGDIPSLRAALTNFIGTNVKWINDVCGPLFEERCIKVDLYLNSMIEPGFMFDDIALTIFAMMSNYHVLVLCHNNYWTIHSKNEYKNCIIQLAYFGGNDFKALVAKTVGADTFLSITTSEQTLVVIDEDPVSDKMPDLENVEDTPQVLEHPNIPDDTDLQTDLIGTGIMPELDLPNETSIRDAGTVHNDVDDTEITDHAQSNENTMDADIPAPVLDPDDTNHEVWDMEQDSEQKDKQDDSTDVAKEQSDNLSDQKITSEELDANNKKENNVDSLAVESDEGKTDSNTDSGIESDDWEPEYKRRKDSL